MKGWIAWIALVMSYIPICFTKIPCQVWRKMFCHANEGWNQSRLGGNAAEMARNDARQLYV